MEVDVARSGAVDRQSAGRPLVPDPGRCLVVTEDAQSDPIGRARPDGEVDLDGVPADRKGLLTAQPAWSDLELRLLPQGVDLADHPLDQSRSGRSRLQGQ